MTDSMRRFLKLLVRRGVKSRLLVVIIGASMFSVPSSYSTVRNEETRPEQGPIVISVEGAYPFHRLFTKTAIVLYQRIISPTKGTSCPMTPHCSEYGRMAFDRFNPIVAFMMTSDRLHRCGHDLSNYELVAVDGQLRFSDPLPAGDEGCQSAQMQDIPNEQRSSDVVLSSPCAADESGEKLTNNTGINDSVLYDFARSLQLSGDYGRSITEYERLLHYFPRSGLRSEASVELFDAYYMKGDYLASARWGEEVLESDLRQDWRPLMKYRIGVSYFRLGNFPRARSCFTDSLVISTDELRNKALILSGFSHAYKLDWTTAMADFSRVDRESPVRLAADNYEHLCQDAMKTSYKSPTIAGLLGIVPGLGYLYDGYKGSAISSLIVNSLFGWATEAAFKDHNGGLGVLLGVLTFGWYSGNIYGSITSAKRKNLSINNQLIMQFDADEYF